MMAGSRQACPEFLYFSLIISSFLVSLWPVPVFSSSVKTVMNLSLLCFEPPCTWNDKRRTDEETGCVYKDGED